MTDHPPFALKAGEPGAKAEGGTEREAAEGRGANEQYSPGFEERRLEALRRYQILDTPPERNFDELVKIGAYICDAPIAMINFIDRDRQWFKAEVGLGVRETPLDVSICAHAILQSGVVVVPDTSKDSRFADNPLVTGAPHLRFYAGVALETEDGYPLGTFCVLDYKPRQLSQVQLEALGALSRQVMMHLELIRANARQAEMLWELEAAKREMALLASTDPLTGLANRRAFDDRLAQELSLVQRRGTPSSLLMADIDFFKRINDKCGHYAGDEALCNFANICREVFRTSDVIGRWGGEEFIVLLPDTPLAQADAVAARLHARLAETPMASTDEPLHISVSIGIIALLPGLDANHALRELDDVLYQAKGAGRNCTVLGRLP
jgi:diguanylate cyclase (GGDEF)-like protein